MIKILLEKIVTPRRTINYYYYYYYYYIREMGDKRLIKGEGKEGSNGDGTGIGGTEKEIREGLGEGSLAI